MKKRKQGIDKRLLRILGVVCLSFLLGVLGGALLANLLSGSARAELTSFLQGALTEGSAVGFWSIFLKYFKYDLLIWLGGWVPLGIFLSGAAFLFRGAAVGFTSAILFTTYGRRGVWIAASSLLPQNMLLIPTYILIMTASVYYLTSWNEQGGKRALRRERRRKQAEYSLLLLGSMVMLAAAAGMERAILL